MISSGMKCFGTQQRPKQFLELHHEMWVSVAYNCLGYSKTSYNTYEEQLHYLSSSQCLLTYPTKIENYVFLLGNP